MEKKKCPQCKNLIFVTAPTCLHCGRPNKFVSRDYINKKWNKESNKISLYNIFNSYYLIFIFILIIITLIIIFR